MQSSHTWNRKPSTPTVNMQNAHMCSFENPQKTVYTSSVLKLSKDSRRPCVVTFFCLKEIMAQNNLLFYSKFSLIWCREYQPMCARSCVSCMLMVHLHIFAITARNQLYAAYTGKWIIRGWPVGLSPLSPNSIDWIYSSAATWNQLFITRLWIHWRILQHGSRCFYNHNQQTWYVWTRPVVLCPSVWAVQTSSLLQLRTIPIKSLSYSF